MDSPEISQRALPLPQLSPQPALATLPEDDCVYLPGRKAQFRAFLAEEISRDAYHSLMDAGFRRSGQMIYQPVCQGCRACVPLRVSTADFQMSKSQRRCYRNNQDLKIQRRKPEPTPEKFKLYEHYRTQWHKAPDAGDFDSFVRFLYESPVDTIELEYRTPDDKLVGVGICDQCDESLSSVYFYFDPDLADRGLGTFSALFEIEYARTFQIPYWYAGFHVAGCKAMEYKANFRPYQLLCPDGVWRGKSSGK